MLFSFIIPPAKFKMIISKGINPKINTFFQIFFHRNECICYFFWVEYFFNLSCMVIYLKLANKTAKFLSIQKCTSLKFVALKIIPGTLFKNIRYIENIIKNHFCHHISQSFKSPLKKHVFIKNIF